MKNTLVMRGEKFEFLCNASKEIESCSIKFVNLGESISIRVRDFAKRETYEYFGKGYKQGDCGIRYFNTTLDMQGTVTCRVGFLEGDEEIEEFTKLDVGIPLSRVELYASNKNFEFIENEEMIFNCSAVGAFPLPHLTVFLGNIN